MGNTISRQNRSSGKKTAQSDLLTSAKCLKSSDASHYSQLSHTSIDIDLQTCSKVHQHTSLSPPKITTTTIPHSIPLLAEIEAGDTEIIQPPPLPPKKFKHLQKLNNNCSDAFKIETATIPFSIDIPLSAHGRADSIEITQPPPLPPQTFIAKQLEQECIDAFKAKDCLKVKQLLPRLSSPSQVRTQIDVHFITLPVVVGLVHLAALNGWFEEFVELIEKYQCKNDSVLAVTVCDYSAQHFAAYQGNLNIIKYLIEECGDQAHLKSYKSVALPLHIASMKNLDIVKYYINDCQCDPNSRDHLFQVPFHYACKGGNIEIVKFFVQVTTQIDPNCAENEGKTPLHVACEYGHLHLVEYLIYENICDPNIADFNGFTILHDVCVKENLSLVKSIVALKVIDPNIRNKVGDTPLHISCRKGYVSIAKYLIEVAGANPDSSNNYGETPLHKACYHGHPELVQYLLSTGRVDPMSRTNNGTTPLAEVASYTKNRFAILTLFEPFEKCRVNYPVHSYAKVFLCGNTTTGKSSLAEVICTRARFPTDHFFDPLECVNGVEALTAGIIPRDVESHEIGNIVLYDFAGHPEYYSAHAAILENIMLYSPAVFLVLVKLTDPVDEIEKQLYYWISFIENLSRNVPGMCEVVIIASHVDLVNDNIELCQHKLAIVEDIARKAVQKQTFAVCEAVDCHRPAGEGIDRLFLSLREVCQKVIDNSDSISLYSHILFAFLTTELDVIAITFGDLVQKINNESVSSIPSDQSVLINLLTTLSDKGLILFLENDDLHRSWIVINKEAVLKEVNGTLFAPTFFKEYRPVASNTGIIPVSVLSNLFPSYNPNMLVGFLTSLEFCHPIDSVTLDTLSTNISCLSSDFSSSEILLFFPALIKVSPPPEVIITTGYGWCLWCPNPHQFLSNRFLHVLLLRIAYTFCLPNPNIGKLQVVSLIHQLARRCILYKNGIWWTNDQGIEVMIEVSDLNRCVTLIVSREKGLEVESSRVRAALVKAILLMKDEFCPSCDSQECLVSPDQLSIIRTTSLSNLSLYSLKDVSRTILLKRQFVVDTNGVNKCDLSSLLGFEIYQNIPVAVMNNLCKPCDPSLTVPESVLQEIYQSYHFLKSALPINSTYTSVKNILDEYSIFNGRNLLVSNIIMVNLLFQ